MTFDDGYDRGDVVRLFFDHNSGGDSIDTAPFAYVDIIVTADDGDAIEGYRANARDNTHGNLRDDAPDDPEPSVSVMDKPLIVRKSAVVMKREFGSVDGPVFVAGDDTDEFKPDDTSADIGDSV